MPRNVRNLCQTAPKPRRGHILGYVAQIRIPKAFSPPATPHPLFAVSKPENRPTRHLDLCTLVEPEGCPDPAWSSQWWFYQGRRAKNKTFSKSVPRPFGMLKQVFWPILSPWRHVLTLGKSQNASKMGCLGTKNGSKTGQKRLKKTILDHLGCTIKWNEPIWSPFGARLRHLGPSKVPNSLENGPFWDRKRVKNGAKTRFSENDPRPFGVLKRDNCAYKQHSAKIIPEHYCYVLLKNVIYLANYNILPALYVGSNPGGRPEFIMGFFCAQPLVQSVCQGFCVHTSLVRSASWGFCVEDFVQEKLGLCTKSLAG